MLKFVLGIVLLVVLAGGGFLWWSAASFTRAIDADVDRLARVARGTGAIVTTDMLAGLPEPVQRHLRWAGVVGTPIPGIVRLKQTGRIRSAPDASWMTFDAEQIYSVDPPAFVWRAWLPGRRLPLVLGRDEYVDGASSILMKAFGLFAVADEHGDALAAAGLMRFLNEIMWFPAAYLGRNVGWRAIDKSSAEVTLSDGQLVAQGTVFFDGEGRLVDFRADRFDTGTGALATWETPITGYATFGGLRLPAHGAGVWKRPTGDFSYIELNVTDVRYEAFGPPSPGTDGPDARDRP